jgi:hypothetical protein
MPFEACFSLARGRSMSSVIFLLAVFATISIPLLPLVSAFVPQAGLWPLKWGQNRFVRGFQIVAVWSLALFGLIRYPSVWSWPGLVVACLATFVGVAVFPNRVFVALNRPRRLSEGLAESAPVLATTIEGETVAWPLETLVPHHVINDRIGETPILAAWCASCRSGFVYVASVRQMPLTFEVFGVWRKNLVMKDRETGTLWQHATGEAIDGPLRPATLEMLPAWETTWGELQSESPGATFAVEPQRSAGLIPKSLKIRALAITAKAQLKGLSQTDRRLDAHEIVIGIVVDGLAKAYPLQALRTLGTIHDEWNGRKFALTHHPPGDRVTVRFDLGEAIPAERQWWLGWSEFHPRSLIYESRSDE